MTIGNAAEFVGPYDDEKIGLDRIANYYYMPGWWEGSAQVTALINLKHGMLYRKHISRLLRFPLLKPI